MGERAVSKMRSLVAVNLGQVDEQKEPITDPKEAVDQLIVSCRELGKIGGDVRNNLPYSANMPGSSLRVLEEHFMRDIRTKLERYETALLELAFVLGNKSLIEEIVGPHPKIVYKEVAK